MMLAFMIALVIITVFVADIMNRSKIEKITYQYETEISYISSQSKKFVDNYTAALAHVDLARESNNDAKYYFDLAIYLYEFSLYQKVIDNCTGAMYYYNISHQEFDISKTLFEQTIEYTPEYYMSLIGYYIDYVQSGLNLTTHGYEMCEYLKFASENYSQGNNGTGNSQIELMNQMLNMYNNEMITFDNYLTKIKNFIEMR